MNRYVGMHKLTRKNLPIKHSKKKTDSMPLT